MRIARLASCLAMDYNQLLANVYYGRLAQFVVRRSAEACQDTGTEPVANYIIGSLYTVTSCFKFLQLYSEDAPDLGGRAF